MTDTVRESIVKYVYNLLKDMDKLEPASDPYDVQFSEVLRDAPDSIKVGKSSVAVVLDLTEVKLYKNYPVVDVQMPLDVEVHLLRTPNVDAGEIVNQYLGAVERGLRADVTCGGLSYEVLITGTEKTPTEGPYENYVSGVVHCEI